jgi:DNA-binding CsgD family transcriptional regulator
MNNDIFDGLISLFSVNISDLTKLPCYVYCKNKEGVYLGYSDYGAVNLGYSNASKICGKTDFELFPKAIAECYRENDKIVMLEKKPLLVREPGLLKDSLPVVFLSYKMPFYANNSVLEGILGFAITQAEQNNETALIRDSSINELAQTCNYCPQQVKAICAVLSTQERECLRYLCQGLTIKMIAQRLQLAPKTVETYLERAKTKMKCHNKAQLILKFIKAGENIVA